jgi:hypothetical protein
VRRVNRDFADRHRRHARQKNSMLILAVKCSMMDSSMTRLCLNIGQNA